MVPSEIKQVDPTTRTTSQRSCDEKTVNQPLLLQTRHNTKNLIDKKSNWGGEANNETTTRFELQRQQRSNKNDERQTSGCKRRQSGNTFSPLRKILNRKMSLAFSRSNSGVVRADISSFQTAEQEKTIVRKNLRKYATVLFFLAVTATGFVLLDTQVKILWRQQKDLLDTFESNATRHNSILQQEDDKLQMFKHIGIALKSAISLISIITCVMLLSYYKNLFRLKKVRHFYPPKMSFVRATPLLRKYLIECVICFVHVPPFLDLYVNIPNEVQIFVLLRLYLLGRYLKEKHDLMNSQSTRFLASVTKTELTSMFLFKTFFMQYPFQLILLAYMILLFIGGYGVWLIEDRYTYLDTVWMLIITMTTVGFGDLTPKTMLGRFAVGITAIVGIFLMALFISLVNEALMLQRREKRILAYVENQDLTRHRKITALNAIGMWYKYHAHMKRHCHNVETISFLGGHHSTYTKNRAGSAKQDLVNKMKGKLLENEMFQAVNEWRRVKNAKGGGYFAQEFMIEDMKNLMTDLTGKMNEMDDKLENVTIDLKTISNNEKTKNIEETEEKKSQHKCSCFHNTKENSMPVGNYGNINTKYNEDLLPTQNGNHRNNNSPFTNDFRQDKFNKFVVNSQKNIRDLLHETTHSRRSSTQVIRQNELVVAFKLLKNQAKIMNNALDDIYYKTRQDICDLENLINSLLICTDTEDDSVDYVPSRDLPV